MRNKLPLEHQGRDIRLRRIKNRLPDDIKAMYAKCWTLMEARIWDGQWYAISDTTGYSDGALNRLYDALCRRAYMRGYVCHMLDIRVTRKQGICFHWHYFRTYHAIEKEASEIATARYMKKNKEQKSYRKERI